MKALSESYKNNFKSVCVFTLAVGGSQRVKKFN